MHAAALTIAVAAIGGAGSALRFSVDGMVQRDRLAAFPAGTLVVNLSGSLVLGVVVGAGAGGDALLLTGTAALGSFTTFSTWMLETQRLAEDGALGIAAVNLIGSLAGGLALAALGHAVGGLL